MTRVDRRNNKVLSSIPHLGNHLNSDRLYLDNTLALRRLLQKLQYLMTAKRLQIQLELETKSSFLLEAMKRHALTNGAPAAPREGVAVVNWAVEAGH